MSETTFPEDTLASVRGAFPASRLARVTTGPQGLTRTVALRLAHEDHEILQARVKASGLRKSAYLRSAVLGLRSEIEVQRERTDEYRALLYNVSAASNNLNQLARQVHLAAKGIGITENTGMALLSLLSELRQDFQASLKQQP